MSLSLVVFALLIYSNTLEGLFVFDDKLRIEENSSIRITEPSAKTLLEAVSGKHSAQSPFGNLTFALNYYLHRYSVVGYHIVNITIHLLTGIALFFLIKATLIIARKQPHNRSKHASIDITHIAFFAALIWLVHPVQTESVSYIVQRLNSMAAMFYVLSLLLYVRGRMSTKAWET